MFGFLRALFKEKPGFSDHPASAATAHVVEMMKARARPTIVLDGIEGETVLRLGGSPRLPSKDMWPDRGGRPLAFLAELDLRALRASGGPEYLPADGFVHVFYDAKNQPWGFDPADRDGVALIFTRAVAEEPVAPPEGKAELVFSPQLLRARRALSYPTPTRLDLPAAVVDAYDIDAICDFERQDFSRACEHRIGGYPSPVQNDAMELEAELASSGIYLGDASGYANIEGGREEAARSQWALLLQIDSDDDAGMMWGDSGMLYIWIRESDARKGDFDKAWCILQCC
jgi:uncharacterized protein YwqG